MPIPGDHRRDRAVLVLLTAWTVGAALAILSAPFGLRVDAARRLEQAPLARDPFDLQGRQENPSERPTFKTSATLLTIDAVVTDKDGRHVTDLTTEDFELVHRGRRQKLQHAIYVSATGTSDADRAPVRQPSSASAVQQNRPAAIVTRALSPRRVQPGRTIAIVIDDLGLSFHSVADVRRALRRFVDDQIEPGDLVAIIRTAGGMGALQQFTTDRRLLHMAVERVQWNGMSRRAVGSFATAEPSPMVGGVDDGGAGALRDRIMAVGSLGAIEFVARGMQQLPGRKSIVLFSEGFGALFEDRQESGQIWRAMTRMLDRANRAGAVIYTVDPRGLQTAGLMAEDNPQLRDFGPPGSGISTFDVAPAVRKEAGVRRGELLDTLEQLMFVAEQTGGRAFLNTNDLNSGIQRALDDQRGYYLLGYEAPAGARSSGWEHGGVMVRVRRPGLKVRARQGLFGPADENRQLDAPTDPLLMAALSPFAASDIGMRLTALFGHDAESGSFIRTMLFIDATGLTFTPGDDGRHVTQADIAQLAIGDNGEVLGNWRRTVTLRLADEQLDEARTHGVIYGTRMAVKKPGAYQVRTSVQDNATARLGSASQFLEVPDVRRGRLAISSVLLQASRGEESSTEAATEDTATDDERWEILGRPSLRIFRPGSGVAFAYEVYDGTGETEPLEATAALLRDGTVVYRGQTDTIARQAEGPRVKTIPVGGVLSLGQQMPPGTYTLEVSVSAGKRRAAQWADFDVQR